MSRRSIRTARRRARFLEALEATGHVLRSAEAAGASVRGFYHWRDTDPDFAAHWEAALQRAEARLEEEAFGCALDGVEAPVNYRGQAVSTVCKFSDRRLMYLLAALRAKQPQSPAGTATGTEIPPENMTDEEIERELAALDAEEAAEKAAERAGAAAALGED